jgi:hypothetical protein
MRRGPGPGPGSSIGGWEHAGGTVIRQRDSALPDPQPNARSSGPIAAIETDNVAAFARDLRVLRAQAGLEYPDMAEKSHYTMRTLASAAGGLRLPTLPVLSAYVKSCGGDVTEWEERWGKLVKAGKNGPDALTSGAGAADGPPQPGQSAPGQPDPGQPGAPGTQGAQGTPPSNSQPGTGGLRETTANEVYVITSAPSRDDRW